MLLIFCYQNLFSGDITDVKYVSLGKMSYQNALFYHYYFKFNNAVFVEAPVIMHPGILNESNYMSLHEKSQIHAACCDSNFFNSTRNVFNLIKNDNFIDNSKCLFGNSSLLFSIKYLFCLLENQIGLPNMYFNSIQPMISQSRTILKELAQKEAVNETNEGFRRRKLSYLETVCSDLKRDFNKEVDLFLENLIKSE